MGKEADGLGGVFVYNSDLFDPPSIGCMVAHFKAILEQLVEDPDCPLLDIQLESDLRTDFRKAMSALQEYEIHQFDL